MYLIWENNKGYVKQYESDTLPTDIKCVVYYNNSCYISEKGKLTRTVTETKVGIPSVVYSL